ncbi:tetratricopeptide repeat protein [Streptomyces sp. NPDC017529]|uniref:tetratricopeptide repeat protein n=1 Tax=Streptomyces sp. NPDC017529 TaxID=3365000 RepID=UPI003789B423
MGKTTLVRRWEAIAGEHGAATAYVGDAIADAVEAMETIIGQLARQGHGAKEFDKALAAYRQRRHEAEAATASPQGDGAPQEAGGGERPGPGPSPGSLVASQVGLAGLGMVPGAGPFVGAVDPAQVALGADRVRAAFAARFRNRDDAQMVLSPLQVLTPLFVQAVGEAAQRVGRVVLFFDTYEYTGTFLDVWLRDVLIEERYGELPAGVMVVAAGQGRLSPTVWSDHLDLVHELELEIFIEAEARQLLATRDIRDEQVIEVILRLSGRLPVLVHLLAEARPATAEDVGDPSGTAVERFLRWENNPARRAAALACALPLELDEDTCRLLTGEEGGAEVFDWLRRRPFVTDRSGRCRYHDVVRDAMLRLQRTQSPRQWERRHILLADTCAQRRLREQQGDDRPPQQWWQEQWWRECRLRETYHRLCAHPHRALPAALGELLHAYAHSPVTLRRWAQTLYRAGCDTDAPALSRWGQDALASLESGQEGIAAVLSRLLASGKLDSGDRALAYALRGREHRDVRDVEPALADYTAALVLEPCLVRAHVGRAWMQMWKGCHDDALAGFARAIELEPHHADAYLFRGTTYTVMLRYDDAIADYTRAIELAPGAIVPLSSRGGVYAHLGRYDDALADCHRVIALAPGRSSSHSARGRVYARMGRFEEALADHDHAVELDAHDVWAYVMRGEAYRYLGRFEEALTDLDCAIELEPDHSWPYVHRGETHRLQGRYEAALADLHRAVELDPADTWTKLHRGRLHRLLGRYDDALSDLLTPGRPGPTEAWRRYEVALVWRVTNQLGWEEELSRSEQLYGDVSVGGFTTRTDAAAMRFIIQCALQSWAKAEQTLESFLRAGPVTVRLRETMDDLEEAVAAFCLPSEPVQLLRRRLDQMLLE